VIILANLGAMASLLLGAMGVFFPAAVEKFVSIKAVGELGVAEIRATYGGFFLGLAAFALYSQDKVAFVALGLGWLGAAIVRLVTFIGGTSTKENAGGIVFELIIGGLCLASLNT